MRYSFDHRLEVWPESHWPGFALREADVFKSYIGRAPQRPTASGIVVYVIRCNIHYSIDPFLKRCGTLWALP